MQNEIQDKTNAYTSKQVQKEIQDKTNACTSKQVQNEIQDKTNACKSKQVQNNILHVKTKFLKTDFQVYAKALHSILV